MQPVKSLQDLVFLKMAEDPIRYLPQLRPELGSKLCNISNPEIIVPYLSQLGHDLLVNEKLQLALLLHKEIGPRLNDYNAYVLTNQAIEWCDSLEILTNYQTTLDKFKDISLEKFRHYEKLMGELKDGYLE